MSEEYKPSPEGENKYKDQIICRGSYALGTACGVCARCIDERNNDPDQPHVTDQEQNTMKQEDNKEMLPSELRSPEIPDNSTKSEIPNHCEQPSVEEIISHYQEVVFQAKAIYGCHEHHFVKILDRLQAQQAEIERLKQGWIAQWELGKKENQALQTEIENNHKVIDEIQRKFHRYREKSSGLYEHAVALQTRIKELEQGHLVWDNSKVAALLQEENHKLRARIKELKDE